MHSIHIFENREALLVLLVGHGNEARVVIFLEHLQRLPFVFVFILVVELEVTFWLCRLLLNRKRCKRQASRISLSFVASGGINSRFIHFERLRLLHSLHTNL